MFVDDNYTRIEVKLEDLEELVRFTHKRVSLAKKVLSNPTEENLYEYNDIVEIHDDIRSNLGIYPKLTEEEKAASAIWKAAQNYENIPDEKSFHEDEENLFSEQMKEYRRDISMGSPY